MFNNLFQKFTALAPREKWLISLAFLAAFWGCWDVFFYTPFKQEQTKLQQRLQDIEAQLMIQQQAAIQLQNQTVTDPNLSKRNQLAELKSQHQHLEKQIRYLHKNFVPPALMAKVLSDMLKQDSHLTLISLETLPVVSLFPSVQKEHLFYQHGLILRFSGNYLAILNYLKSLETMRWHLVWDSIHYQVKNYPTAEITLRIYTLSLQKEWLDV
jgi:MSHA biogenesis protein MshJ